MITVDTNLIAYLLMGGEKTEHARTVFRRDPVWVAPLLWRSEFRNVIAMQMRQSGLGIHDALELMREAETLMRGAEYQVESGSVLALASSSGCSAYDCEFVALARGLSVPLITADREILKAFPALAISPAAYVAGT